MQERTKGIVLSGIDAPSGHQRPPRRFPSGRLCADPGCSTRLSIYNESDYCSLHLKSWMRIRGKKAP